jgi:hypothetical protein
VVLLGGPSVLFTSRDEISLAAGRQLDSAGNNAASTLLETALSVPIVVATLLLLERRRHSPAEVSRWAALLIVALCLLANNPIVQPRYWFGTVLVSLVAAYLPIHRRAAFRLFAVGAIVGMVVVFPYADRFRRAEVDSSRPGLRDTFVEKTDHDAFQEVANSIEYVEAEGLTLGRQLLGATLFWVPRFAWPDKPSDTGPLLADAQGYDLKNISAPLWAEGYVNWGVWGVGGFMFIFGAVSGALDSSWLERAGRGRSASLSALIPALAAYQLILLRGSLLQAMWKPSVLIVLSFLCSSPSSQRRRRKTIQVDRSGAGR